MFLCDDLAETSRHTPVDFIPEHKILVARQEVDFRFFVSLDVFLESPVIIDQLIDGTGEITGTAELVAGFLQFVPAVGDKSSSLSVVETVRQVQFVQMDIEEETDEQVDV